MANRSSGVDYRDIDEKIILRYEAPLESQDPPRTVSLTIVR